MSRPLPGRTLLSAINRCALVALEGLDKLELRERFMVSVDISCDKGKVGKTTQHEAEFTNPVRGTFTIDQNALGRFQLISHIVITGVDKTEATTGH